MGTSTALADSVSPASAGSACADLCYDRWEICIANGVIDPNACEDEYNRCMLHCRR